MDAAEGPDEGAALGAGAAGVGTPAAAAAAASAAVTLGAAAAAGVSEGAAFWGARRPMEGACTPHSICTQQKEWVLIIWCFLRG